MDTIKGTVERITYYNRDNGYSVLKIKPESRQSLPRIGVNLEGLLTVVGYLPEISSGERVEISGEFSTHSKHGLQFNAGKLEKLAPVSEIGMERYLGSGLIKGIGPQLAKRIVAYFKKETLDIIENHPQRLLEVPGIGEDRREKIIKVWDEQKAVKEIMLFLHDHKISSNLAVKIYKTYGDQAIETVKNNPYQLEQDIYGIGFKTADRIGQNLGLSYDHPARIDAGVIYAINESINEGNVYIPQTNLSTRAQELLGVDKKIIGESLIRLVDGGRIRREIREQPQVNDQIYSPKIAEVTQGYGDQIVYLTPFFHCEKAAARKVKDLIDSPITSWQGALNFDEDYYSDDQKFAIQTALTHNISILTGGPGTGKTTCLKALIIALKENNRSYALTSPTGRAAKRLSETTGRSACTIHRLLGFSADGSYKFNENYPLKVDFLIIDEASMLDLLLFYHLLKAINLGTQILFVGDVDQLPSVGAGDVLRDLINSNMISVSRLTTIFRQSEVSQIVTNAHRINQGLMPYFAKSSEGDFFLFNSEDAESTAKWVLDLVCSRIPNNFNFHPVKDIQVLSPLYRGQAGVDLLNSALQSSLNPQTPQKIEQKLFGSVFRMGDKVMQVRNNYDKEVFNGDIGRIVDIDSVDQNLVVEFDGNRKVNYEFTEADELVLAYAISVHKAQGSEFPVVVMPIITQHYVMLQRNLLYTAITRAAKLCVLVGSKKAIRIAINNNQVSKRFTLLSERLKSLET